VSTSNDSKKQPRHIAVAGNIGSGKTTLTTKLAKYFQWEPHYEDVENNPYLYDFYQDMPRWSFNLQIYFLNSRFQQIIDIKNGDHTVIQDRTIYEDAKIFAPNLHAMGLMSTRDYENYLGIFETLDSLIEPPDLLIYLKATIPTIVNNIPKRGREYEENLRLEYLRRRNEYHEGWIKTYEHKLPVINVDEINFEDNTVPLSAVVQRVQGALFGIFSYSHPAIGHHLSECTNFLSAQ
jgi:deoxyadenosine/deoxycytidine kinase